MSDLTLAGSNAAILASAGFGPVDTSAFSQPTAVVPYQLQSSSASSSNSTDGLTGAISTIFSSFTSGLSSAVNAAATGVGAYLSGQGTPQVVGYDRYNNPIYLVTNSDGSQYTTSSPGLPSMPGAPANYPERNATSYNGTGLWGWITNSLGLPSPQPIAQIGSYPLAISGGTTVTGAPASPAIPSVILIAAVAAVALVLWKS